MEDFPRISEFWAGSREFRKHEKRDAMYKVATRLINEYWGKPAEVADGLGVLLLTWNQALYRYGIFDFDKLESFLRDRKKVLSDFRKRDILSWSQKDDLNVKTLFSDLMKALIAEGKDGKLRKSPVGVAKALHLIAPNFFPIWDIEISKGYGCHWYKSEFAPEKYIYFCKKIMDFVQYLLDQRIKDKTGMTLLKIIDEYNYSKFTKGWI